MYLIERSLGLTTLKWLKEYLSSYRNYWVVLLSCYCLFGCQALFIVADDNEKAVAKVISLDGDWNFLPTNSGSANYYSPGADFSNASSITVPGNWFNQGFEHHGIAWYKKQFEVNDLIEPEQLYQLVFGGVDYFADVWVNGHYVGFHEGYFQSFQFDISNYLQQGNNTLVVRVNSPLEDAGQSWSLHKKYIKGVLGHHDTRPGGAWSERGQEKNTGGIWQSVWIEKSDSVSIDALQFTANIDEDKRSSAHFDVNVTTKKSLSATLKYQLYFDGKQVEQYQQRILLKAGQQKFLARLPVKQRLLWSPWEHGSANLYELKVSIISHRVPLIEKITTVAFREFKVEEPSGQWLINGKPLFVRGTNYIAWQWLSEFSANDFAKDLQLMKAANINAVRVHAHVLPQEFYQEANKLGMVVWQDFPLQWGYVDSDEFLINAKKQAQEMVEQFYNHPSILVWSAHNEPPWDADWMKYKYKDYNNKQNIYLDEQVYKTLQIADSSRYSHKSSLTSEHPWLGWYSGSWTDYAKPTKERWITEFGAQALPIKSTLEAIVGKENLWPDTPEKWQVWKYHNFQQEQNFKIAKIDKGDNIDEFIANSQQYQMKLTAFAAESYRRQKSNPVNAIFQFMFVEDWASMNWGVVDYQRKTKPAYESLKIAYQPLLPSIEYDIEANTTCCKANFSLWIINDYPSIFSNYQLLYQVYKEGELLYEQTLPKNIAASSSEKITDVALNSLTAGSYQLRWLVLDENLSTVAENNYFWQLSEGNIETVAVTDE